MYCFNDCKEVIGKCMMCDKSEYFAYLRHFSIHHYVKLIRPIHAPRLIFRTAVKMNSSRQS